MLSTEFLEHRYDNHSSQSYDILKTTMDYSEVEFNHPENDIENTLREYEHLANRPQEIIDISETRLTINHLIKYWDENDLSGLGRLNTILTKLMREQI